MLTENEVLRRCRAIEGYTLSQLASHLNLVIPEHALQRKGWAGAILEKALGAEAGNQSLPDFIELGIELKTLPILASGKPAESTFICSIPLLNIHEQTWETSQCWSKLKKVLWIPIEADSKIPYSYRRIGRAILWTPSCEEQIILSQDWTELTTLINHGKIHEVSAAIGMYLQIRPKAANAKTLCYGFDELGQKILTLPRGFYLRSTFTASSILSIK